MVDEVLLENVFFSNLFVCVPESVVSNDEDLLPANY